MKITTFNPQIITKDAETIIQLFQALGFEKRHNPKGIGELNVEGIRMKDANGFYLDISVPDILLPQDVTVIRMNVDDFDEAYQMLTEHGFKNFYEGKTVEMKSFESALMISPSGFTINLVQHIKEHDKMKNALKLTSVGNARELGGFIINGKKVKHNLLLRTASLAAIMPEDLSALETFYQTAAVVDLRMSLERKVSEDPEIPGAVNIFLPVLEAEDFPGFDEETAKIITDPGADRFALMKTAADMGMFSDRLYVDFLFSDRGKEAFRSFFKCLLELPGDRAVLWHCTDGKDRTGVASMLVLTALGADTETILEDYMLTNEYNMEKLAGIRSELEHAPMTREYKELALFGAGAVYEKYMINALLAMEERCGSPQDYLAFELGVGSAECKELCHKFLE